MTASLAPAALFGLLIGSFLNVVAWRLPRGESLLHPGSHCPGCDAPVRPYDNVPVFSWLVLRGRCRGCKEPISARYPVVEAVTALLWAAVVAGLWGEGADRIVLGLVLVTFLVPMTLIDLEHRIIPNKLTLPAAVLAIALGAALAPDRLPEQLAWGAGAGGFFLLAAVAHPKGMGMGDVKLAGVLGLYLGKAVAPALMVALVAGVLVGALVIARLGAEQGRRTQVPFGPFLALGAVVALFVGDGLMDSYLDRF
ncbi:A24 family peptidase [Conexibacter sp. SYSU D00693]|uniref:prepilin peptidase n=1 Tax=Conexibacter sp. SYSU D00693 TaxID=2812560 RepID=UPI00196A308E|nr:A24 family peptidase [Conexibacter sp. SYSU D00693]